MYIHTCVHICVRLHVHVHTCILDLLIVVLNLLYYHCRVHMPSVTYLRLDGSVPANSRHDLVQRYNYVYSAVQCISTDVHVHNYICSPKSAYIILVKNEAKKNGFKFAFCVHIQ